MSNQPSEQSAPRPGPPPGAGSRPADRPFDVGGQLPPPPPQARQLVRDPYTNLGGVASGLSHHYGIDVSLIRLTFVVFTFVSGFGLLVYFIAWLVVPRAKFWPPVGGVQQVRKLSVRELAIGLLIMGVVGGLFLNGGTFSGMLIPVILVGGGIWLLAQPPNESAPLPPPPNARPVGSAPGSTSPGYGQAGYTAGYPQSGSGQSGSAQAGAAGVGSMGQAAPYSSGWSQQGQPVDTIRRPARVRPPGSPVPPSSRRRRVLIGGLVFAVVIVPIMVIGAMVIAVGTSDFDTDFDAVYRPATVAEIPETLEHEAGDITLDLSELRTSDFDEPLSIDFDLEFGDALIIVPEDLAVEVDASAGLGDVSVFDNNSDGIDPGLSVVDDDAVLELDLHVGFGSLSVERPSDS